jgi:aspartate--ammonia ligase
VSFITTQQLEDIYPELTPKEREYAYLKENKTAFIMNIGDVLKSGVKHDGRAPDYDDWTLNGDIFFWNDALGCAFEISSMGIRVDEISLGEQLTKSGCEHRRNLPFHKMLLEGKLPLTMGGGIGQSRLCMLLLQKIHIGEVQVSVWDKNTISGCMAAGIKLL